MIWDWYHKTWNIIKCVFYTSLFMLVILGGNNIKFLSVVWQAAIMNFWFSSYWYTHYSITFRSSEKKTGYGDRLCHTCRVTIVPWPGWGETDTYVNHFYAFTDKTTDKQTLIQLLDSAHLVRRADGSLRRDNDDELVQSAVGFVCNRALMSS